MSAPTPLPATMRAWVLDGSAAGAMEKTMRLVPDHPVPESFARVARGDATGPGGRDALVVRVLYAALNPVDYKIPELPLAGRLVPRRPATPALDFCGRVVASTAPAFAPGQLVAGSVEPLSQHGTLAEYTLAHAASVVALPPGAGVDLAAAATMAVCGTTAWGALAPHIRAAQAQPGRDAAARPVHVFVNGGSGGVGTYAIQIAKALGCTVTATCSAANAALCTRLGADRVLDYRTREPGAALTALTATATDGPGPVDVALDLVGHSFALYKAGDAYLAPGAPFVMVGLHPATAAHILLRPRLLGGGRHRAAPYTNTTTAEGLAAVLGWLAAGQITVPIEKEVALEDVPAAYALIKTQRTRGKIVVKVGEDAQ